MDLLTKFRKSQILPFFVFRRNGLFYTVFFDKVCPKVPLLLNLLNFTELTTEHHDALSDYHSHHIFMCRYA